jgi:hypothetical protein
MKKKGRDLQLNSLSRYSKESPGLVLEEHGHCEVPAGCGGVVLRWTNPHRAMPMEFWTHTTGEARFYIDGVQPQSARPMVSYGEHVLSFRIEHAEINSGVLIFAGLYDEDKMTHTGLSRKSGRKVYVLSADDGTWKWTASEPQDDAWMTPGFDDSLWNAMTRHEFPEADKEDRNRYRLSKLVEFGACGLTVQQGADCLWIRKVFSLSNS